MRRCRAGTPLLKEEVGAEDIAEVVGAWTGIPVSLKATWVYAGLAPGYTGLYQFNVVVPDVPASDLVPLTFTLNGNPGTQALYIAVQTGS